MKRSIGLIFLFGAASCAPEQIVAATSVGGGADTAGMSGAAGANGGADAGGGMDGGISAPTCAANSDCALGELCEKPNCTAAAGTCIAQPQFCNAAPGPVCGCNGITYFNDCLRQANLIAAATSGACSAEGVQCGGFDRQQCPGESYCGRLLPLGPMGNQCPPDAPGNCWVLPAVCDSVPAGGDRWSACAGGANCLDICAAIRTEQPYARAGRCPPP
ncbi:MAG TPA: hypothetical protein VIK01_02685 [Polyangiaceae bacterium]